MNALSGLRTDTAFRGLPDVVQQIIESADQQPIWSVALGVAADCLFEETGDELAADALRWLARTNQRVYCHRHAFSIGECRHTYWMCPIPDDESWIKFASGVTDEFADYLPKEFCGRGVKIGWWGENCCYDATTVVTAVVKTWLLIPEARRIELWKMADEIWRWRQESEGV